MFEVVSENENYSIETSDERDEWNSFVERNDGPPYAHRGWSDAVESYGHDHWNLVARRRDTRSIVAALPLTHVKSRVFGSQLLSPAFAERGSIVLDEDEDSMGAMRLLLHQTRQMADARDVDFVSLRGSQVSGVDDFTVKNRYVTFRVPVSRGREAVRAGVEDSRLRQVDQAANNSSLQFHVGDSLDDLRAYYQLYLETMRGHGSPAHSFEFFRTLWEQLQHDGNFRLGLISHDGSLINGIIDLSMGSNVYQWGVVSDYDYRDLNGGSLLLWKSLERAAEEGYDTYEFGRTREGSGVYLFKKSFGGSKTWYEDLHYFPDRAAKLPNPEDSKYELAREVWQRLPLRITRFLGPQIRKRIGM